MDDSRLGNELVTCQLSNTLQERVASTVFVVFLPTVCGYPG